MHVTLMFMVKIRTTVSHPLQAQSSGGLRDVNPLQSKAIRGALSTADIEQAAERITE